MATKLNPRLAKIHRNYTVEEITRLYGVHKNTVRSWIKAGLPIVDARKPYLVLGRELAVYLAAKRGLRKRPCGPGEMFCMKCRCPKQPTGMAVSYEPQTALLGNLKGICSGCRSMLNRRTSARKLVGLMSIFKVTLPEALRHITECPSPTVNSDIEGVIRNG